MKIRNLSPARKFAAVALAAGTTVVAAAGPVLACAGLVTPSGNVRLLRTSTLAAWADGIEHYVTSFTFDGGGAEVGSIVPLPAIPSKVERGGDWTLQRLERETQPQPAAAPKAAPATAESDSAEVIYETKIDALDITILKGGGPAVFQWAQEHGFTLTPDAPEVLDFYAARSPIFMAARFDATRAEERGQGQGEGTPIHLSIPLDEPWVPLRVLGLGRQAEEVINADVYLLTPDRPALLPEPTGGRFDQQTGQPVRQAPGDGLIQRRSEWASKSLLDDLRSDKGMEWVPSEMWLTYLAIDEQAGRLKYDLATETEGTEPSPVEAGLESPPPPSTTTTAAPTTTTAAPAPPTTAATVGTRATRQSAPALTPPVPTPTTASPLPVTPPIAVEPDALLPESASASSAPGDAVDEVAATPVSATQSGDDGLPAPLVAALVGAGLGAAVAAGARQVKRRSVS